MAEIAKVLQGDMALILVMTRKRDDLCNRFHIGDEASAYCQWAVVTLARRNNVSQFLNQCSSFR